ncbi:hypothetical protein AMTRI_Chr09g12190 [Amborella trichopoda]
MIKALGNLSLTEYRRRTHTISPANISLIAKAVSVYKMCPTLIGPSSEFVPDSKDQEPQTCWASYIGREGTYMLSIICWERNMGLNGGYLRHLQEPLARN